MPNGSHQRAFVTMSAILSADDLNDFISPGVACIKPVETLPKKELQNPEVSNIDPSKSSRLAAVQWTKADL